MKKFTLFALWCAIFIISTQNLFAQGISGDVYDAWSAGTYSITGDITVPDGQTLTLQSGVVLEFDAGVTLTVAGRLIANGNATDSVVFTAADSNNPWGGIFIDNTDGSMDDNGTTQFSYCSFSYSENAGSADDINEGGVLNIVKFSDFTLSNSRFSYCQGQYGGAINLSKVHNISINNCSFNDLVAYDGSGGAICFVDSCHYITLDNNTFEDCMVDFLLDNTSGIYRYKGGAIAFLDAIDLNDDQLHSNLTITNNSFANCQNGAVVGGQYRSYKHASGGAIFVAGRTDEINITGNTFTDISTLSTGGAIHMHAGCTNVDIIDNDFTDCYAESGGAFTASEKIRDRLGNYATGSSVGLFENLTISGNTFTNCFSAQSSGAIKLAYGGNGSGMANCVIEENTFTNCKAAADELTEDTSDQGGGGAIHISNNQTGPIYIRDNEFDSCSSGNEGGGGGGAIHIAADNRGIMEITGNTFSKCRSNVVQTSSGNGGAINFGQVCSNVLLDDNTFSDCVAYSYDGSATEDAGNGGAIHFGQECYDITLTNNVFERDTAQHHGGAFMLGQDCLNFTIEGNTLTGNHANNNGGAIFFSQDVIGEFLVENCTFTSNSSWVRGGAIFVGGGASVSLTDVVATDNYAPTGGALWYGSDCSGVILNSEITDNTAYFGGGAFFGGASSSDSVLIDNSSFCGNIAEIAGDAIIGGYDSEGNDYRNPAITNSMIQGEQEGIVFFTDDPLFDNFTGYEEFIPDLTADDVESGHVGTFINNSDCEDLTPPVALCANFYLHDIGAVGGSISISPQTIDNGSYDNSGIKSLSLDQTTFTCGDVGENLVTLTVTDNFDNVASCTARVVIDDPNAPVFEAIDDISLEIDGCETTVVYPEIIANDGCEVTLTLLAGLGEEGTFPLGTTVETWEAKDLAGNADTISFNVIVTTLAVPTIDAIADLTLDNDMEWVEVDMEGIGDVSCLMDGLLVSAGTTDETIITSLTVDYDNLATTGLLTVGLEKGLTGSATIVVTLENAAGGVTEESFEIEVMEINDAPVLTYPVEDQTVNAARVLKILLNAVSGEYFTDEEDQVLTLTVVEEGSSALPVWATLSGDTLVCAPVLADTGCVNIIVIATDTEGATASDTFTVCVDGYVLGIGDIRQGFEISMYPNPTSGRVNVEFAKVRPGTTEIKVYSISGLEVYRKDFSYGSDIRFDMSNEVSGIYLVQIIQGSDIQTRKLILNKK